MIICLKIECCVYKWHESKSTWITKMSCSNIIRWTNIRTKQIWFKLYNSYGFSFYSSLKKVDQNIELMEANMRVFYNQSPINAIRNYLIFKVQAIQIAKPTKTLGDKASTIKKPDLFLYVPQPEWPLLS